MLGDELKQLREKKGISRKEAAELLGIDQSTYGKYELNKRIPDFEMLKKICSIYNAGLSSILEEGIYQNKALIKKYFELVCYKIKSDLSSGGLYDLISSADFEGYDFEMKLMILSAFIKEIKIDEDKKTLEITYYFNENLLSVPENLQLSEEKEFLALYRSLSLEKRREVMGFMKGLMQK